MKCRFIQLDVALYTRILSATRSRTRTYQISVDGMHGYIRSFSNVYYNEKYMDVAQDWLNEEFRDNLGDKYSLYSEPLTIDGGSQNLKGDEFSWGSAYTMYWRYQLNKEEQKALNKLQETAPEQYELVMKNLDARCAYSSAFKVIGDVKTNGDLKKSSLEFYDSILAYESPMGKNEWRMLDDKLQIMWTAASYANAWNHQYLDAMALYGERKGIAFARESFDIYQTELVGYAQSALSEYRGENTVEIQMPLDRDEHICKDYLYMTLEKQKDGWYVTSAEYNKGLEVETLYVDTDYDGDGGLDTVQRTVDLETNMVMYDVLFSNGDILETNVWYDYHVAVPSFEGVDFTGDGKNEMIFRVAYPTSTNPLGVGELIVFRDNMSYRRMILPFVCGTESYEQRLVVTYDKAEGQAIEISVADTEFSHVVEIPDNLWKDYQYGTTYVDGYEQAHTVWNYKVQEINEVPQLVCTIQLFDKWSEWGLDVVLEYQEGSFVIDDIQFCEDIYEAWT